MKSENVADFIDIELQTLAPMVVSTAYLTDPSCVYLYKTVHQYIYQNPSKKREFLID